MGAAPVAGQCGHLPAHILQPGSPQRLRVHPRAGDLQALDARDLCVPARESRAHLLQHAHALLLRTEAGRAAREQDLHLVLRAVRRRGRAAFLRVLAHRRGRRRVRGRVRSGAGVRPLLAARGDLHLGRSSHPGPHARALHGGIEPLRGGGWRPGRDRALRPSGGPRHRLAVPARVGAPPAPPGGRANAVDPGRARGDRCRCAHPLGRHSPGPAPRDQPRRGGFPAAEGQEGRPQGADAG